MLRRLHAVTSIIKTPALRDFLDGLFADMSIAIPLLQVPASLRYHHNYRGGLFEHSVECAEIVASIPHLSEKQREVGILAALFHDIGKIKTMTPDLSRTHLGRMVDHASLTTEICSKHLVELEESWPAGSHALRHIWACMSTKYWAYRPSITIVHVVKMADKISCDLAIKLADDVLLQMPNISTTTQHIVQQRQVTS